MSAAELITGVLALTGASLVTLAGLGLLRLPDALTRASAVAKAAALGVVLLIVAVAVHDPSPMVLVVLALITLAHVVTVPLSGLAIGRAAYRSGAVHASTTTLDQRGDKAHDETAHHESEGDDQRRIT